MSSQRLAEKVHEIVAGAVAPSLVTNTMAQLRSAFVHATALDIATWLGSTPAPAAAKQRQAGRPTSGPNTKPAGFKRDAAEKQRLKDSILAFLVGGPNNTAGICSHLREPKDYVWGVLLKELRADSKVVLVGDRKSARYYLAGSEPATGAPEAPSAPETPETAIDATGMAPEAVQGSSDEAAATSDARETGRVRTRKAKRRAA